MPNRLARLTSAQISNVAGNGSSANGIITTAAKRRVGEGQDQSSRGYGHALVERFPIEQCLRVSQVDGQIRRSVSEDLPTEESTTDQRQHDQENAPDVCPGCHRCSLGRITGVFPLPGFRQSTARPPRLCIYLWHCGNRNPKAKIRTEDARAVRADA